jgi:hypothetical protein
MIDTVQTAFFGNCFSLAHWLADVHTRLAHQVARKEDLLLVFGHSAVRQPNGMGNRVISTRLSCFCVRLLFLGSALTYVCTNGRPLPQSRPGVQYKFKHKFAVVDLQIFDLPDTDELQNAWVCFSNSGTKQV